MRPKTNIQPLHDRVLVRKVEDPTQPKRSVILVQKDPRSVDADGGDYRRNFIWGEVLAVGPGRRNKYGERIATEVKPGMIVAFTDWNDFIDPNSVNEDPVELYVRSTQGTSLQGLAMIREGDIGLIHNA